MLGDIDPSLINEFLSESTELVEQLDVDLLDLEQCSDPDQTSELLNSLFRALHTVKGSASFLALEPIATFAHAAEDALNHLRHGEVQVTPSVIDVLLKSADLLRSQIDDLRDGQDLRRCPEALMEGLHQVSASATGAGEPAESDDVAESEAGLESDEMVLELPSQKADLVSYMASDLLEATNQIESALSEAREVTSRAEAVAGLDELTPGLARTAAFFELPDLNKLVQLLELAASRLDGVSETLLDDTFVRLEAVVQLMRSLSESVARSRVPIWDIELFVERTSSVLDGQPLEADVAGAASTVDEVLVLDGVRPTPSDDQGPEPSVDEPGEGADEVVGSEAAGTGNAAATSAAQTNNRGAAANAASATIRVEVARLESLLNLVGQLVLTKNRVLSLNRRLQEAAVDSELLEEVLLTSNELDRLTGNLQAGVTNTRLQPLAKLFDRYPRVIRDIARGTSKKIRLDVIGKETEVDKGVLELLGDPLVHILRNSADHGIESPSDRSAAGKDETGVIRLIAEHQGSHVRIAIEDDGKGINRDRIAAKAIEQGLATPDQVAALSDHEVMQFIFAAGFSTADQVSDLSGRGVGMDVVATNIRKMNGTVQVRSTPGKGTTIDITIPLTVAIMPAMVVGVCAELYCIPLMSIVEIVRSDRSVVQHANGQPVMRLRDEVLPLMGLSRILAGAHDDEGRFAVIVEVGGQRAGLLVDHLVGQQEIVIKPLDDVQSEAGVFSGATIRENGDVSLILDVNRLLRNELSREQEACASMAT